MVTSDFSITEFSNDNFAIIGRFLYIGTQYEKSFRAYFTVNVLKYSSYFKNKMKEFKNIKIDNYSEKALFEINEISSKLTFNRMISFFFDNIINKILPSDDFKAIFIKAKDFRNYIAHELCNFELNEIEKDSFRNHLIKDLEDEVKNLIMCVLIMGNAINEFNKEPTLINIDKKIDEIYQWIIYTE